MEITRDDFDRLEIKVDKLVDAISRLVLVEERILAHSMRLSKVEDSVEAGNKEIVKVDRKVDQWINRGIGVWGLAAIGFAAFQAMWRH